VEDEDDEAELAIEELNLMADGGGMLEILLNALASIQILRQCG
jgi:hypothetical protein